MAKLKKGNSKSEAAEQVENLKKETAKLKEEKAGKKAKKEEKAGKKEKAKKEAVGRTTKHVYPSNVTTNAEKKNYRTEVRNKAKKLGIEVEEYYSNPAKFEAMLAEKANKKAEKKGKEEKATKKGKKEEPKEEPIAEKKAAKKKAAKKED